MAEHTPGPWAAQINEHGQINIIGPEEYGGKWLIAKTVSRHEVDAANAELIVHAVNSHADMLEALKGVVRVADRKTVEFDAARAAIAKAELSSGDRGND